MRSEKGLLKFELQGIDLKVSIPDTRGAKKLQGSTLHRTRDYCSIFYFMIANVFSHEIHPVSKI